MEKSLSQLQKIMSDSNLTLTNSNNTVSNKLVKDSKAQENKAMEKKELRFKDFLTQSWKTESGDTRFNIYGLGEDGAIYKKIGNEGRGWIKMNMTLEFREERKLDNDEEGS